MKRFNELGEALSSTMMKKIIGGSVDDPKNVLICTSTCIASYITSCEAGGNGSTFCMNAANDYCIPFCSDL